jgi:hypothetical protein
MSSEPNEEITAEISISYLALADAVRRHEEATASGSVARRPRDHALYDRLQQLDNPPPNRFQLHGH